MRLPANLTQQLVCCKVTSIPSLFTGHPIHTANQVYYMQTHCWIQALRRYKGISVDNTATSLRCASPAELWLLRKYDQAMPTLQACCRMLMKTSFVTQIFSMTIRNLLREAWSSVSQQQFPTSAWTPSLWWARVQAHEPTSTLSCSHILTCTTRIALVHHAHLVIILATSLCKNVGSAVCK